MRVYIRAGLLGACSAPFNVPASLGVSSLGGPRGGGKHSPRVVTVTGGGRTDQDCPGTTRGEGTGERTVMAASFFDCISRNQVLRNLRQGGLGKSMHVGG